MSLLRFGTLCFLLLLLSVPVKAESEEESSRLSDEIKPFTGEGIPERPAPLLELGESFFNTGEIGGGFRLPTGAVWTPSLVLWGTLRTAVQYVDTADEELAEWASRFDLFSNLYLTSTERILVGIRPVDTSGRFTRYTFKAPDALADEEESFEDEFNADITTLFFEGDFGEIFPFLDPHDAHSLDIGIAVGRQSLLFQDGIFLNDSLDSLGLSKLNLKYPSVVNHRLAFVWAWNELNRAGLPRDVEDASLFGLFQEIDLSFSTIEADIAYVESESTGNSFVLGLGASQRISQLNTALRLLGSIAEGEKLEQNQEGGLLFLELSSTPTASDDLIYATGYWAPEEFRSASRDPNLGGPLSAAGILFESAGLGRYAAALDSSTDSSVGGALGFQKFFNETRSQIVLEIAERYALRGSGQRATATGIRLQQALGRRSLIRFDTYLRYSARAAGVLESSDADEFDHGVRLEWLFNL